MSQAETTLDVEARGGETLIQRLYGIDIRTPWAVRGMAARTEGRWDVEFVDGDADTLAAAAAHVPASQADWWAQHAALPDQDPRYRRWTGLFEFLVSADARRIQARTLKDGCEEALLGYLLVDALSFSMVRLGWEPLHATAVLTGHGVVAFIAESGGGKSTIGAALVHGGCPLVTDDMLVLTRTADGFRAEPGPPRIKLYRDIAVRIFGSDRNGVKMNPVTEKPIIRLDADEVVREAHPLAAIYLISESPPAGEPDRPSAGHLFTRARIATDPRRDRGALPIGTGAPRTPVQVRDGARQPGAGQDFFIPAEQGGAVPGAGRAPR